MYKNLMDIARALIAENGFLPCFIARNMYYDETVRVYRMEWNDWSQYGNAYGQYVDFPSAENVKIESSGCRYWELVKTIDGTCESVIKHRLGMNERGRYIYEFEEGLPHGNEMDSDVDCN